MGTIKSPAFHNDTANAIVPPLPNTTVTNRKHTHYGVGVDVLILDAQGPRLPRTVIAVGN